MATTAGNVLSDRVLKVSAAACPLELLDGDGRDEASYAAVFNDGAYSGVVLLDDDAVASESRTFGEILPQQRSTTVSETTSLEELGRSFVDSSADCIEVVDERGAFLGVVTRESLIEGLLAERKQMTSQLQQRRDAFRQQRDGEPRWESNELESRVEERTAELVEANRHLENKIQDRRRTAQEFQLLAENVPALFAYVDTNGFYRFVSRRYEEWFGVPHEKIAGKSIREVVGDRFYAEMRNHVEAALNGTSVSYEALLPFRKVGTRWVSVTYVSHIDAGKVRGFYALITDITQRKKAEETQRFTQFAVDRAADCIYWMTPDARFFYVNDAACRMLGYSREELLSMSVHDIDPDFPAKVWPDFWQELKKRRAFTVEARHRTKDGRLVPIEVHVNHLEFEGEEYNCSIVRDITERRRSQEALENRTRQQNAVADLGQRALAATDLSHLMDEAVALVRTTLDVDFCKVLELLPDGEALLLRAGVGWNDGLVGRATVGANTDSQAGFTLLSDEPIVVEDLSSEHRFSGPRLLCDHGVISGISVVIRGSESPFGVLGAHTRSRRAFATNDIHFVQAIANVLAGAIERKRAEERSRQLQEQLAHVARLNTMGEMAAGIAHEINQPLTAIATYCYAAREALRDFPSSNADDVEQLLEKATEQAIRSGEIIRRMRSLVRKTAPARSSTDMRELIGEVVGLVEPEVRLRGTRLQVNVDDTLPDVFVDRIPIQQVLINLVRNAVDAMDDVPSDGRTLKITTLTSGPETIEVAVCDSGTGIAVEDWDRVLDAFFTTKPQGMGMGLAISRSIVESHGGRLWLTPNRPRGVTFHFTLPIAKDRSRGIRS